MTAEYWAVVFAKPSKLTALRAANVADEVEGHLAAGDPKEAWRSIKGWYRSVEDRPPKPNYQRMETLTQEQIDLYTAAPPPGAPIPINVDPFDVNDEMPTDGEIREAVKSLPNGRAGGLGGMVPRRRGRRERGQVGTGRQMASISPTNTGHLGAWEHPSADDLDGDSAPPERGESLSRCRVAGANLEVSGSPDGQAIS